MTAFDDGNYGDDGESFAIELQGGTSYTLLVTGHEPPDFGPLDFELDQLSTPGNDTCEQAVTISPASLPFSETVDLWNFTSTINLSMASINASEGFWKFTPDETGVYRISLAGDRFRPVLGILTGECGSLTEVYVGRQANFGEFGETVGMVFEAGVTYTVVAQSDNAATSGIVELTVQGVGASEENDLCANAKVFTPADLPFTDSVDMAVLSDDFDTDVDGGGVPEAFWQFTPDENNGPLRISVGGGPDTILAVYTGECGNFTEVVVWNENGFEGQGETRKLGLNAGVTYTIVAGTASTDDDGIVTLYVDDLTRLQVGNTCAEAKVISPTEVPFFDTVDTGSLTNTRNFRVGGSADAHWRLTPSQTGSYRVSLSGLDTVLGVFTGECGAFVSILDQDLDNLENHGETAVVSLDAGVTYTFVGEGFSTFQRGAMTFEIEVDDTPSCPVPPFCVAINWFETGEGLLGDLNRDGKVNGKDAILLIQD